MVLTEVLIADLIPLRERGNGSVSGLERGPWVPSLVP